MAYLFCSKLREVIEWSDCIHSVFLFSAYVKQVILCIFVASVMRMGSEGGYRNQCNKKLFAKDYITLYLAAANLLQLAMVVRAQILFSGRFF